MPGIDPRARCPQCWRAANAATDAISGTQPIAGDVSICIACASILVFVENADGLLVLRIATEPEVRALTPTQRRLLAAATQYINRQTAATKRTQ